MKSYSTVKEGTGGGERFVSRFGGDCRGYDRAYADNAPSHDTQISVEHCRENLHLALATDEPVIGECEAAKLVDRIFECGLDGLNPRDAGRVTLSTPVQPLPKHREEGARKDIEPLSEYNSFASCWYAMGHIRDDVEPRYGAELFGGVLCYFKRHSNYILQSFHRVAYPHRLATAHQPDFASSERVPRILSTLRGRPSCVLVATDLRGCDGAAPPRLVQRNCRGLPSLARAMWSNGRFLLPKWLRAS